jgi:chemotaxis methyl-accepting protein methylase
MQHQSVVTLEDLLDRIHRRRGLDLRSYARATVERRVRGRMRQMNIESYESYLRLLEGSSEEMDYLLSRITLQASAFFRNPAVFSLLRDRVIPELATAERRARVWSAGCGYGEEAYTLAMLFAEAEPWGERAPPEIYGTDWDGEALAVAEAGRYPKEATAPLSPDQLATHFSLEPDGQRVVYRVSDRVRAMVRFTLHDLTTTREAPGGGLFDLVCCRNVLVYYTGELRERVQDLICRSVAPGGYLCLGPTEWVAPPFAAEFDVVSRMARLFQRCASGARSA